MRVRTGARGGREGEMERGRGERARSLSSARPRTRVSAPGGSRRTSALLRLSLSSVRSRCRLTRTAAARGLSLFPDRLFRSVSLGGGARPSPVGGRGAPRVGIPPWLPDGAGSVRGVSRRGGGPPFRVSAPDPCPGT